MWGEGRKSASIYVVSTPPLSPLRRRATSDSDSRIRSESHPASDTTVRRVAPHTDAQSASPRNTERFAHNPSVRSTKRQGLDDEAVQPLSRKRDKTNRSPLSDMTMNLSCPASSGV